VGPGRFSPALHEAVAQGKVRRTSRGLYALVPGAPDPGGGVPADDAQHGHGTGQRRRRHSPLRRQETGRDRVCQAPGSPEELKTPPPDPTGSLTPGIPALSLPVQGPITSQPGHRLPEMKRNRDLSPAGEPVHGIAGWAGSSCWPGRASPAGRIEVPGAIWLALAGTRVSPCSSYRHVSGVPLALGKLPDFQVAPDVRPYAGDERSQGCRNQQQPRFTDHCVPFSLSTSASTRLFPTGNCMPHRRGDSCQRRAGGRPRV